MFAACATASAEPTHMNMPEGSSEVYLTLAAGYGPRSEGSAQRAMFVTPLISAQWSNGVFVDMNSLGVHLSDRVNMQYGLLATPSMSRGATISGNGSSSKRKFTPEVGGFFNYSVAHGIGLSSGVMYGGSSDRRGLNMNLGAHMWVPLAAHHSVGLEMRMRLANRSALQADFGVTAEQAGAGDIGAHGVSGGVRDVAIAAHWRWDVTHKYTFRTSVAWQWLQGSAAASPRTEEPAGAQVTTILSYQF